MTLIVLCIVGALSVWASNGVFELLAHRVGSFSRPWTLLTYPFAIGTLAGGGFGLIWLAFLAMWLYQVGGQIEGELGTKKYVGLWLILTILPALVLLPTAFLGSQKLFAEGTMLFGSLLPVGGITVVWATRYPTTPVSMFGVIPLQAKWIGYFMVAAVILSYGGNGNFLIGIVAALSLLFPFFFARNQVPGFPYSVGAYSKARQTKEQIRKEKEYFDDVKRREKEREERERLRKLFESSLDEDDRR